MAKPLVLVLTPKQLEELEWARDKHPRPYVRERAAALLKIADGRSGRDVAQHGLLKAHSPNTIYRWVQRFKAAGLQGLLVSPGRGRKPAYFPRYPDKDSAREALLHVVRRDPRQFGQECNRWTLDRIRQVCDWLTLRTASGLSRLLKRLKIHLKRARLHVHSPDNDYLAKLHDIHIHVKRSMADLELVVVLFQDEFTYQRCPTLALAYELSGRSQPLAERGYDPNAEWRVVATLDVWTGRVIYEQHRHIGVKQLIGFYQKVCAAYSYAQHIYMVQDNWPIHHHPDVLAALKPQKLKWPTHVPKTWPTEPTSQAQGLNLPIELLMLPTYASWTNPIEKLWRKLKQEELHLHRFQDDWSGLRQHVAACLDRFAEGSRELLRYVGLSEPEKLYRTALTTFALSPP